MQRFNDIGLKFVLMLSLVSWSMGFAQFEIPPKPKDSKQHFVYDYINVLSEKDSTSLNIKLRRYADTTSTQIVVAIIHSTEGEYINFLGAEWLKQWGIGQKDKDNGILILLAKDDRKIGINTGYGVEHLLTDAISKRIINRDIVPYFKNNDYYGGLNRATDAIFEVMNGEYQNTGRSPTVDFPIEVFIFLFIIFVIFIIAISKSRGGGRGGRGNGNSDTAKSILEAIILSNMGRGSYRRRSSGGFGGFGGSSSGGSFGGGFGGGGFGGGFGGGSGGGGGASGGW